MHNTPPALASRRTLLHTAAAGLAMPLLGGATQAQTQTSAPPMPQPLSARYPDPAIEILDPSFARYRLFSASVERLATGFRWAEGPVWNFEGS